MLFLSPIFRKIMKVSLEAFHYFNNNMNYLLAGILTIVMTVSSLNTNAQQLTFTTEQQLEQRYNNEIKSFWQQGKFSQFSGMEQVSIHYAQFISPQNQQCLVLVPGRSEGYLKYQELAYDLTNAGFNLFIIDHRGQGISQRMQSDPHKGYVALFDHYSDDLHYFVENIVKTQCPEQSIYLLAHSMGGAISARYMQRYETPIKAAVLASPMIAINGGGIPTWLAEFIINSGDKLSKWFSQDSWYFLGQGGYESTPFADNKLMQSRLRYQLFTNLYESTPKLQLGGVTYRWLQEAVKVNKDLFTDIDNLKTPTLVLQAGSDTVVDNSAQDAFCQALHATYEHSCPDGKPLVIEGARHEIFFELDNYRNQGLNETLNWFSRH